MTTTISANAWRDATCGAGVAALAFQVGHTAAVAQRGDTVAAVQTILAVQTCDMVAVVQTGHTVAAGRTAPVSFPMSRRLTIGSGCAAAGGANGHGRKPRPPRGHPDSVCQTHPIRVCD